MNVGQNKAKYGYWIASGLLNLFQNFSGAFFGFAGIYILTRLLSETEFGVWGIYLTVGTLLEIVRNGLIQNAVIKFVSAKPDEESEIISASLTITGLITAFCVLLILLFGRSLSRLLNAPELDALLHLYIIIFLISWPLIQFSCLEQAHLSYKGVVASNFVRQFTTFVFLAGCFIKGWVPSLQLMVYVQIGAVLLGLFTSWCFVRKFLVFSFKLSAKWMRDIWDYGKFGFGTSMSSLLSGNIDQWMISSIMNPASVASFRVAVQVTNLIDIPTNTISTIVFPQSARRMETDGPEAIKYLYERSVGAILAVLIPAVVFMYLFDDIVMTLFASEKYIKAVPILNVTLLYALLIPFGRQFGAILDSIGKTKLTFKIVIFTATLNLTLNFFFIQHWGALGAAYATLVSNVIGFIIAQRILYKMLKVNVINPFVYAAHFYKEFYTLYIKKFFSKKVATNQ